MKRIKKKIENFFSGQEYISGNKDEDKSEWPPELIDIVTKCALSNKPLDGVASSTKLHDDLLQLQTSAKTNKVPEPGFLQALSLLAPLLGNEDQLEEWFRAFVDPAINSAGHKVDVVKASKNFIISVLDGGTFPLFKRVTRNPDDVESGSDNSKKPRGSNLQKESKQPEPSDSVETSNPSVHPFSDMPEEFNTSSHIYFAWILDIYLGITINKWFKFKEKGMDLEERRRFIVKNARDILIEWGSEHEKEFFERLVYRSLQLEHRQMILSLVSCYVSEFSKTKKVKLIFDTPLIDSIYNTLLYDNSSTALTIASKVFAMILPHICTCSSFNPFIPFLIYGRLALWTSFSYDFMQSPEDQQATTVNQPGNISNSLALQLSNPDNKKDDISLSAFGNYLVAPKGWSVLTSTFDLPDVYMIDIKPLFSLLYGLYPLNFLSYIRNPKAYLSTKDMSYRKADSVSPMVFPESWNGDVIKDRSLQLFRSYFINPLIAAHSIDEEFDTSTILRTFPLPADIASHCFSLGDKLQNISTVSRRQSSIRHNQQQHIQQSPHTMNNNRMKKVDTTFENEYFPDCVTLFDPNAAINEEEADPDRNSSISDKSPSVNSQPANSGEIPLFASPISYRRNSNNSQPTPLLNVSSPSLIGVDDMIGEHQKLFTKQDKSVSETRKPYTSVMDAMNPDALNLNDPGPPPSYLSRNNTVSNVNRFTSAPVLTSIASTSATSPLSRPFRDIRDSPLLIGQAEPSSSVTSVNVKSPLASASTGPFSIDEPDPIILSPTLMSVAEPSSLSTARQHLSGNNSTVSNSQISNGSTTNNKNFKPTSNNADVSNTKFGKGKHNSNNNDQSISTLFYQREFSILRNEYDFICYLEFHARYQLRKALNKRCADMSFEQKILQLSDANLSLHSRIKEMEQQLEESFSNLKEIYEQNAKKEENFIKRLKTVQEDLTEKNIELQTLKIDLQEKSSENKELLESVKQKQEKITHLESQLKDFTRDEKRVQDYKDALLKSEETILDLKRKYANVLESKDENIIDWTEFKEDFKTDNPPSDDTSKTSPNTSKERVASSGQPPSTEEAETAQKLKNSSADCTPTSSEITPVTTNSSTANQKTSNALETKNNNTSIATLELEDLFLYMKNMRIRIKAAEKENKKLKNEHHLTNTNLRNEINRISDSKKRPSEELSKMIDKFRKEHLSQQKALEDEYNKLLNNYELLQSEFDRYKQESEATIDQIRTEQKPKYICLDSFVDDNSPIPNQQRRPSSLEGFDRHIPETSQLVNSPKFHTATRPSPPEIVTSTVIPHQTSMRGAHPNQITQSSRTTSHTSIHKASQQTNQNTRTSSSKSPTLTSRTLSQSNTKKKPAFMGRGGLQNS